MDARLYPDIARMEAELRARTVLDWTVVRPAILTRGPATVEEAAPVSDAAAEMAAGGFRHLPVVDATGALVGMISERDLRALLGTDVARFADATSDVLSEPVLEAMTPDPVSLPPTATLPLFNVALTATVPSWQV